MAWGMALPNGFGVFWPDGDFEGWTDGLKAHFLTRMTPDQQAPFGEGPRGALRYMGHAALKFVNEPGSTPAPDRPPLSPIEPHEVPRSFTAAKTYAELGSLIVLSNRILAVDAALKEVVDQLEPGVHQFFPVEIAMPKGRIFPRPYFVLVIRQYLQAFSAERSRPGSWKERFPGVYSHDPSKQGTNGLAFSRAAIGRAHLWRERGFREHLTCFSAELEQAITAADLRIPAHHQMMEI